MRSSEFHRRSFLVLGLTLMIASAQAASSPVGLWRTFDDRTGKPRGVVKVFEANGTLHGRVEQILDAADQGRVCEKCTDDRKGKPILGMEIFSDLRPAGEGWEGHILDPQTGGIYSCTAHLASGGQELVLRGYLMISLIGRSQTWQRLPTP